MKTQSLKLENPTHTDTTINIYCLAFKQSDRCLASMGLTGIPFLTALNGQGPENKTELNQTKPPCQIGRQSVKQRTKFLSKNGKQISNTRRNKI